MTAPAWVEDALPDDERIVDTEELEEGKLAVVSTPDRGFILRDRFLRSPEVWPFEVEVPGLGGAVSTTTEPLPDAAREAVDEPESGEPAKRRTASEVFGDVHEVEDVEGIGETYGQRLRATGVEDTEQLWRVDVDRAVDDVEAAPKSVRRWQTQAELMALRDVGPQYAELLARCGVESIPDLADREPAELFGHIEAKQDDLGVSIQGSAVNESRVRTWIKRARGHDPDGRRVRGSGSEDSPLERLSGVGPKRARHLGEHGVTTLENLLEVDPEDLADELGVGVETARAWHREVDLTRIHGIGPKRAESLRNAGVHTVTELAEADAAELAEALDVGEETVVDWQDRAR